MKEAFNVEAHWKQRLFHGSLPFDFVTKCQRCDPTIPFPGIIWNKKTKNQTLCKTNRDTNFAEKKLEAFLLPWSLPCLCHWKQRRYKLLQIVSFRWIARKFPQRVESPKGIGIKIETWFGIFTSLLNDWRDLQNLINHFSLKAFRDEQRFQRHKRKIFVFTLTFELYYFIVSREIRTARVDKDCLV